MKYLIGFLGGLLSAILLDWITDILEPARSRVKNWIWKKRRIMIRIEKDKAILEADLPHINVPHLEREFRPIGKF